MESSEKVKSRWTRSFFTALDRSHHEEKYVCDICHKEATTPSALTLHRSTHQIERRYRCDPCQVSFHSPGHLQKHLRSSAHEQRVKMTQAFGVPTSDNPRPYGCSECNTAFRKHGHLAKHLRSKAHIMNLETNGRIPAGTYAALEKSSNVELREKMVTTNLEQSISSLRSIAFSLALDTANGPVAAAEDCSMDQSPLNLEAHVKSSLDERFGASNSQTIDEPPSGAPKGAEHGEPNEVKHEQTLLQLQQHQQQRDELAKGEPPKAHEPLGTRRANFETATAHRGAPAQAHAPATTSAGRLAAHPVALLAPAARSQPVAPVHQRQQPSARYLHHEQQQQQQPGLLSQLRRAHEPPPRLSFYAADPESDPLASFEHSIAE